MIQLLYCKASQILVWPAVYVLVTSCSITMMIQLLYCKASQILVWPAVYVLVTSCSITMMIQLLYCKASQILVWPAVYVLVTSCSITMMIQLLYCKASQILVWPAVYVLVTSCSITMMIQLLYCKASQILVWPAVYVLVTSCSITMMIQLLYCKASQILVWPAVYVLVTSCSITMMIQLLYCKASQILVWPAVYVLVTSCSIIMVIEQDVTRTYTAGQTKIWGASQHKSLSSWWLHRMLGAQTGPAGKTKTGDASMDTSWSPWWSNSMPGCHKHWNHQSDRQRKTKRSWSWWWSNRMLQTQTTSSTDGEKQRVPTTVEKLIILSKFGEVWCLFSFIQGLPTNSEGRIARNKSNSSSVTCRAISTGCNWREKSCQSSGAIKRVCMHRCTLHEDDSDGNRWWWWWWVKIMVLVRCLILHNRTTLKCLQVKQHPQKQTAKQCINKLLMFPLRTTGWHETAVTLNSLIYPKLLFYWHTTIVWNTLTPVLLTYHNTIVWNTLNSCLPTYHNSLKYPKFLKWHIIVKQNKHQTTVMRL